MTNENQHISRIETMWSMVQNAQRDDSISSDAAKRQMLDRYGAAVKRYLRGAIRDEDTADDLFQEFVVRFLMGKYSGADMDRGRFRSFLKTVLYRLVAEYFRKQGREKSVPMGSRLPDVESPEATDEDDPEFNRVWSDELLKKAWAALQTAEESTGRPVFTVMQIKVRNPGLKSTQIAEQLSQQTDREFSSGNTRVLLHRAREQFADFLVDEVQQSLETSDLDRVSDELQALNLYAHCKLALQRLREASQSS